MLKNTILKSECAWDNQARFRNNSVNGDKMMTLILVGWTAFGMSTLLVYGF